ncbi:MULTISPECIES: cysteine-rich CWC family protein [unclassified Bradyrhizobium]|uniref:cysteine-rich CWC family protein n=1 Tax=unclassified Bradyrhizobium TaxID=2631580 RepID=UPI0028E96BF1|nr:MULTISPECIES: cysteine-rich CWC family protein [unclassified Bradyrhizobium]
MTNRLESAPLLEGVARRLTCAACGTEFTCDPGGACWCFEEAVRLPLPAAGASGSDQDCLCRDCLRRLANERNAAAR